MFKNIRRGRGRSGKKLIEWAKWCFAKQKFDCSLCHLIQKDQGGVRCKGIDDEGGRCPDGKIPYLFPENHEIWDLFQMMLPGLRDGMGGYNYTAIQVTFDIYKVKQCHRQRMFKKIVKLIEVINAERAKEDNK